MSKGRAENRFAIEGGHDFAVVLFRGSRDLDALVVLHTEDGGAVATRTFGIPALGGEAGSATVSPLAAELDLSDAPPLGPGPDVLLSLEAGGGLTVTTREPQGMVTRSCRRDDDGDAR